MSGLLVLGYSRIDQVIVFHYAGERGAGFYGAANRLLEQAVVIPGAVATTLLPVLTRARDRADGEIQRIYQLGFEALSAIGLGALAFAIPCGGQTLALLFGASFAEAGPTFAILMAVFVVISVGYLTGSAVLLWDLQRRYVLFAAAGFAVNVLANLWLVPQHGYVAAAWVTLATELVVVGLTARAALRAMGWTPQLGVVLRTLVASATTAVLLRLAVAAGLPIGVLLVIAPALNGGLVAASWGQRRTELVQLARTRRAA